MVALMHQPRDGAGTYTFSSRPRAVPARNKYRDPFGGEPNADQAKYGNIMYDRRIVRGNTYAQNVLPATAQPDPIDVQKQQEARRRAIARKRASEQLKPRTPEPMEGRKHTDVQTELYLEELTDRVEDAEVSTQTDAFLDRPPTPLFVPAKTGLDAATQILEGELFDFDLEVRPILEVLVGKTVEQSLLEVMEEEELADLRAHQRRFLQLRNAELVEAQRLEEQERRRREEKERRASQQAALLKKETETAGKIAARAFAQSYLQDLVPSVFGVLEENNYFFDPVERDIEREFMPWLMQNVEAGMHRERVARDCLNLIIREMVTNRDQIYSSLNEEIEAPIRAAIEAALNAKSHTAQADDMPPPAAGVAGARADAEADPAAEETISENDTSNERLNGEIAEEL